jgi:hypothetical protein
LQTKVQAACEEKKLNLLSCWSSMLKHCSKQTSNIYTICLDNDTYKHFYFGIIIDKCFTTINERLVTCNQVLK